MNTKYTRRKAAFLAVFMTVWALTGCLPRPEKPAVTTAVPYQEEMSEALTESEQQARKDQALAEQKRFAALEQQIFIDEISDCLLDLHYLLKHPENFGITQTKHLLAPLSLDAMNESRQIRQKLQAELSTYNVTLLTENQKLLYRILESFLKTEALSDGLELYYQPLASTIGLQAELPILLCEYAFYDRQDVEDYLSILDAIDDYYTEILAYEQKIAEAGLMMSDTSIDHVIESCEGYLLVPGDNFMIDTFNQRLEKVEGLTPEETSAYQQRNADLLEQSFVPAYQLLIDGMKALKGTGTNQKGMCGFPDGKKYYQYLVYANTGTSYSSVEELMNAVENALLENVKTTSTLLSEHPELAQQLESYQFSQTEASAMLKELEKLASKEFPELPKCRFTLKDVPKALELSLSPAFYLKSPIDDVTENVIYINRNPRYPEETLFPTIAHEGYPGHLYQNVYFNTHCASNLRRILSFPGYSEGWAAYVERLSYTMDNGLSPELGKLLAANSMATLGLHAYLDLAVNYLGWERDDVRDYLTHYYTDTEVVEASADSMFQVMVENPANYLSYFVGALEIQNMRAAAEAELGQKFDPKAFHKFLLDVGNAPFDVIQAYFSSWVMDQKV